jgi:hypothetical protein
VVISWSPETTPLRFPRLAPRHRAAAIRDNGVESGNDGFTDRLWNRSTTGGRMPSPPQAWKHSVRHETHDISTTTIIRHDGQRRASRSLVWIPHWRDWVSGTPFFAAAGCRSISTRRMSRSRQGQSCRGRHLSRVISTRRFLSPRAMLSKRWQHDPGSHTIPGGIWSCFSRCSPEGTPNIKHPPLCRTHNSDLSRPGPLPRTKHCPRRASRSVEERLLVRAAFDFSRK